MFHQDNAPAYSALSVKAFFAKYGITVLAIHRIRLAPFDFFLFSKVKSELKGTRFDNVEAVIAKATEVLNKLTEADFQHCYEQQKINMERCRHRQGEYIEGDKLSNVSGDH